MTTMAETSASVSFIMAMQWDYVAKKNTKAYSKNPFGISMNERLNMEKALNLLLDLDHLAKEDAPLWTPYQAVCCTSEEIQHPWAISSGNHREPLYNEYLYFNHNNRQIIYNQDKVPEGFDKSFARAYANLIHKNQRNIVTLARKIEQNKSYYYIARKTSQKSQGLKYVLYRLPLSSIELRIYDVGIMLLSIRCNHETNARDSHYEVLRGAELKKFFNPTCKEKQELKNDSLNNLFQNNSPAIFKDIAHESDIAWILDCGRRTFCPRSLEKGSYPDDWPLFSCLSLNQNHEEPIVLCNYIDQLNISPSESFPWLSKLLSPRCISLNSYVSQIGSPKNDTLVLDSFNDDRMYLHGSVVSDQLAENISDAYVHRADPSDNQKSHLMKWHAISFADNNWNSCNCPDYEMVRRLAEGYTYPRWTGYNTLYSLNYHNMIQLMSHSAPSFMTTNMDWMYYQLFLVGILQRCCLQRFYREASGILISGKGNKAILRTALKDKYIVFLNRIWSNEITEQEQGKEMFDILQKNMMLEKDVAFLDQALEELSEQERKALDTSINKILIPLSIIGGVSSIIGLIKDQADAVQDILKELLGDGIADKALELLNKWRPCVHIGKLLLFTLLAIPIIVCSGKVLLHLLQRVRDRIRKK